MGASPATYTATFQTQYQLTTAASPAAGGSLSPASGTYFNAGSVVSVQATANAGYEFANFTGGLTGAVNPQNITMNAPANVGANFTPLPALTASLGEVNVESSTSVQVLLNLANTGVGAATNATITSISGIVVVAGTGTATVASGVPTDVGTINPDSSGVAIEIYNWPLRRPPSSSR